MKNKSIIILLLLICLLIPIEAKAIDTNNFFNEDISFKYKYYETSDGYAMPFALYTPTSVEKGDSVPMILWLHGAGAVDGDEWSLRGSGFPSVLQNSSIELNKFDAYVLCPHLKGER